MPDFLGPPVAALNRQPNCQEVWSGQRSARQDTEQPRSRAKVA